jgi:glycosyltransferase involved in cell wall biosynthesis
MRVLLVQGALMPTQMAPWEGATHHGIDLHVACAPFDDFWQIPSVDPPVSITIHRFEPRGWIRRQHLWWVYPGLGRLIKRLEPDVIHVCAEVYGLLYSQLDFEDHPIAGHSTDNIWDDGSWLERTIRLQRAGRILRRLSGLASWNQEGLELGRKYGLRPGAPTAVVPGRLTSPQPFEQAASKRDAHRDRYGFGDECVVGFVGRLLPQKGLDWLLESFANCEKRHEARVVVFGKGPMESEWQALARDLDVDVTFAGSVPPEEIPGVLAAFDLLVVPSIRVADWAEQFGRVIVEAMFAGTPVVASRSGAIPEVVQDAGILVTERSRTELTEVLDLLISDENERRALGRRGRESANERYRPEVLGGILADFWHQIVGSSHG